MRPLRPFCGTVLKAQLLTLPATISTRANGVVTTQLSFLPPASSSATDVCGSSDSRPATVQPPEPPPTTTKSNVSVTNGPPNCFCSPPPCGEGSGVGVHEHCACGYPPPRPSPARGERVYCFRHCERSEAIQSHGERLDCFVASLLAMTTFCLSAATTKTAASFAAVRSCRHRADRDRRAG